MTKIQKDLVQIAVMIAVLILLVLFAGCKDKGLFDSRWTAGNNNFNYKVDSSTNNAGGYKVVDASNNRASITLLKSTQTVITAPIGSNNKVDIVGIATMTITAVMSILEKCDKIISVERGDFVLYKGGENIPGNVKITKTYIKYPNGKIEECQTIEPKTNDESNGVKFFKTFCLYTIIAILIALVWWWVKKHYDIKLLTKEQ